MLILFLIILGTNLSLASLVYFRNPRGRTNRIFAAFVCWVTIWIFCNYMENEPLNPGLAALFLKLDFALAPLMVYFFLLFCLNFQKVSFLTSRAREVLALLPGLPLAVFSFSDLIITQISQFPGGGIDFELGPLFSLYAAYIVVCVGGGSLNLFLKYRRSRGIEKMQMFYVMMGFVIAPSIILITNLFLQLQISVEAFRLGNSSFIILIIFTTYAILRYRLMDIRIIIKRATISLASMLLILGVALLLWFPVGTYFSILPTVNFFLILLISLIFYQPLQSLIQKYANRYLFVSIYSTQEAIKKLTRKVAIASVRDFKGLGSIVIGTIMDSLKLDKAGILLKDKKSEGYIVQELRGFGEENRVFLDQDSFLTQCLTEDEKPRILEELVLRIKNVDYDKKEEERLIRLRDEMMRIEAGVCFPLMNKNQLIGILILGNKVSGEAYSKQDLELLEVLASQLAIAFENTRLYEEVERSLLERKKLYQILLNISSTFDISRILRLIVDSAIKLTNSQRSIIMILDKKAEELYQAAIGASSKKFSYPIERLRSNGIFWRAVKKKKPILAKEGSSGFPVIRPEDKTRGIRTVVGFPLIGQEGVLGALIVSSTSVDAFGEEEKQRLSILAEQAAITLGKAQLIKDIEQAKIKLQNWGEELERKVKEKTEELERSQALVLQSEKLAGLGQLAAGVAHEIRNPLGIIATSMYYLNEILPEKRKEVKKHFHIVESEIDRCQVIINNLLEFSRTSNIEVEPIDVNALINMTLSLVEKDLFGRDIHLIKKMESVPKIKGNLDEIKQVFLNLILNATQAM
ncbi:GAF domain-containing protein, partial [Candidatus Aerophobetes bacterium]|nr:GAF domain-containing protein [Candidatus Aerophobetes bacterium]